MGRDDFAHGTHGRSLWFAKGKVHSRVHQRVALTRRSARSTAIGDSLGSAEFRQAHADAQGRPSAADFTSTGHIDEHYSIGPANGRIVRGMLDAGQVTASQ